TSTWSGHRGSIWGVEPGIRTDRGSPGALGSLWIVTARAVCSGSTPSSTLLLWTRGSRSSHCGPIRIGLPSLRSTEQRGDEHQRRVVLDRVLVRGVGTQIVRVAALTTGPGCHVVLAIAVRSAYQDAGYEAANREHRPVVRILDRVGPVAGDV